MNRNSLTDKIDQLNNLHKQSMDVVVFGEPSQATKRLMGTAVITSEFAPQPIEVKAQPDQVPDTELPLNELAIIATTGPAPQSKQQ